MRQRFGFDVEVLTRGVQPNDLNNKPREVNDNIVVDEIIPPQHKPIAPRGRAYNPTHMMCEEDDIDLDRDGAKRALVLLALP